MPDAPTTYNVWRRQNDGYVGVSAGRGPFGGGTGPGDDKPTRFTILLTTTDWSEARTLIERERDTPKHRALLASWAAYNASDLHEAVTP